MPLAKRAALAITLADAARNRRPGHLHGHRATGGDRHDRLPRGRPGVAEQRRVTWTVVAGIEEPGSWVPGRRNRRRPPTRGGAITDPWSPGRALSRRSAREEAGPGRRPRPTRHRKPDCSKVAARRGMVRGGAGDRPRTAGSGGARPGRPPRPTLATCDRFPPPLAEERPARRAGWPRHGRVALEADLARHHAAGSAAPPSPSVRSVANAKCSRGWPSNGPAETSGESDPDESSVLVQERRRLRVDVGVHDDRNALSSGPVDASGTAGRCGVDAPLGGDAAGLRLDDRVAASRRRTRPGGGIIDPAGSAGGGAPGPPYRARRAPSRRTT